MFKNLHILDREYPSDRFLDYLVVSVLWSHSFPKLLQYLFLISSNLQIIAILMRGQLDLIIKPGGPGLVQNLQDTFKLFATQDLLSLDDDASVTVLQTIVMLLWVYFFTFVVAFGIIFKNYYWKKKESKLEAIFITGLGQFHLAIGFWISNILLFQAMCLNHPTLEREIESLFVFISAIVLIILNYVVSTFYAVFAYNPFIYSSTFSSHSAIFQIGIFAFKGIIPFVVTLLTDEIFRNWSFVCISFTIMLYQYYKLTSTFPYYEHIAMKIAVIFSSTCLSISAVNLFVSAIGLYSSEFAIYIDIFLVVVVVRLAINHFNSIVRTYLKTDSSDLISEQDVLKKIFSLRFLFDQAKVTLSSNGVATRKEIDFWGIWSSLVKESVFQNLNQTTIIEEFRKYYTVSQQNIIKSILKDATKRLKYTYKLKIMLCNLSLENGEQVSTGIYYLAALSKAEGFNRIVYLKLHQKVQQKVYSFFNGDLTQQEKTLDLKSYMDLESVSVNFLQMIYLNARRSIAFWETYKKTGTRIKDLYNTHLEIEKDYDNINNFWKKYIENNKLFASSLNTVYSIYLALVRNSPDLGKKTLEKHNSSNTPMQKFNNEGPLSLENLSSPHNITFYASMAKEKLGKALYVSPNVTELLGWAQEDLKGVNVSILVPNFMQKRHDLALVHHLDKVSSGVASQRLYKNLNTFVKNKAGYKVPCYVYLSLYPYITGELIYTAIVRLKKSDGNIILVDKDGIIEGFTKDIGDRFNLDPNKPIKIRDICESHRILERVLDNLTKLIRQQTGRHYHPKHVEGTEEEPVHPGVNVDEGYTEDFSTNLSQTIEAKFYSSSIGEGSPRRQESSSPYTIQINPRKFWDSYYFILKLEEHSKKEYRKILRPGKSLKVQILNTKEVSAPDTPDETPTNYEDPWVTSTRLFSTANSPSQTLLKTVLTAANVHKLNFKKKLQQQQHYSMHRSLSKIDGSQSVITRDLGGEEDEKLSEFMEVANYKLTKKDKKKTGGILDILELGETNSASPSVGPGHHSKLEEAVYVVPKDQRLRTVKWLTAVFVLLTLAILIAFEVKNKNIILLGNENIRVVNKSLVVLREICQINKAVRLFSVFSSPLFLNMPLSDRSRYQSLGLNVSTFGILEETLHDSTNQLNQINSFLRTYTNKIDPKTELSLFENQVPLQEGSFNQIQNFTRSANIFDLTTAFVVNAIKVSSSKFGDMQAISFILDNTLSNILVLGENISCMLIQNSDIQSKGLVSFVVTVIISMAVFSLVFVYINVNFIRLFVKKRSRLIDIFERLEIEEIDKQVNWMRKFSCILDENNMDGKKVSIRLEKEIFTGVYVKKSQAKPIKKQLDTRSINQTLIIFSLTKVLLVALMFSAYIVVLAVVKKQSNLIQTDLGFVTGANRYLYQITLLSTIIYQYVVENGRFQVKNHSVEEEWDQLVRDISQAQTFLLSTFLGKEDGAGSHIPVRIIFRENLCDKIGLQDYHAIIFCNNIAGGALQKGVIGFSSFIMDTLNSVKGNFDESSKTSQDKINVLQMKDLVVLETIMNNFSEMIYDQISERIQNHAKEDYDGLDRTMTNLVLIYIVICASLGGLIRVWLERGLEKEMVGWRTIVRRIPSDIVGSNKMLRQYLLRNSGGVLSAFKKSL